MTHYSNDPSNVRVDFFKESGKWYMTEQLDMNAHYNDKFVQDAVADALDESRPEREPRWWRNFIVVVNEPYHHNAYPVMFIGGHDRIARN